MLIAKGYSDESVEEGVINASVASTSIVDRMGEIIDQDGWDLKNFKKNPALLWGHNIREEKPPIGRVEKIWFEGEGKNKRLMFKAVFDMADNFAAEVWRKFKDGFLNAFSVGFLPVEREGNTYTKSELLEISAVSVPANPQALVQLRSMGFETLEWEELADIEESKATVPFVSYPPMSEGSGWDGSGAKKRLKDWSGDDMSKYKKGFAWYDSENPENLGSYKLPHHDIVNGSMQTNWRGVAAAMAALLGARGGVDIPEGERKSVYNHLKNHYKQFDKEVPDFRMIEEQILKGLDEEVEALYEWDFIENVKEVVADMKKCKPKKQKEVDLNPLRDALRIVNQSTAIALKNLKSLKGGEN
jgi:HK97 family phage prohead protease